MSTEQDTPEETESTPSAPADGAPTEEVARQVLGYCREHPEDPDSLGMLAELGPWLSRRDLAREVVLGVSPVVHRVLAQEQPSPAEHAFLVIVFSLLLEQEGERDGIDGLFVAWLGHASTFGPGHTPPPSFQKPGFVQRIADLLGWGALKLDRDREALERFIGWFNSWVPRNKFKARRTFDVLRRNIHAPELWKKVRL